MLKWALGAIIILILLSGVALSILLDQPERFRPQIEALAAEQVGAPIRLGQLSWQWQPNFALSVSEVEINPNDGPIVQVQLVDVDFKASYCTPDRAITGRARDRGGAYVGVTKGSV